MKALKGVINAVFMKRPGAQITASFNSTGLDLASANRNKIDIFPGTITDGTHTPALTESSDNSTFTAVAAGDMVGTLAAIASNTNQTVSYIGKLRYVRVEVTVTGSPSTGGYYCIYGQTESKKQN